MERLEKCEKQRERVNVDPTLSSFLPRFLSN
jgi:hypothetical protein